MGNSERPYACPALPYAWRGMVASKYKRPGLKKATRNLVQWGQGPGGFKGVGAVSQLVVWSGWIICAALTTRSEEDNMGLALPRENNVEKQVRALEFKIMDEEENRHR